MRSKLKNFGGISFLFLALLAAASYSAAEPPVPDSGKAQFFEQFKKWREGINAIFLHIGPRSNISDEDIQEMQALDQRILVPLGPKALIYVLPTEQADSWIGGAMGKISKFLPHNVLLSKKPKNLSSTTEEFPELLEKDVVWDARKVFLKWWLEGRERTPQWFGERYPQWLALRQEGKTAEAKAVYQKLLDIGLPAIPLWLEKLKAKPDAATQQAITEALAYLSDGAIKPGLPVVDYLNWWQTDHEKWTVPFPRNRAAYIEFLVKEAATNDGLGVAYATTISRVEDRNAIAALIGLLRHPNPAVRAVSLEQLQKLVGEALPEPYRLPATETPWETRSDLVESRQYEPIRKIIGEARTASAQPEAGEAVALTLEAWWRDAKTTPIHWERAWASL